MLHHQATSPALSNVLHFRQGFTKLLRLDSNLQSSCLKSGVGGITWYATVPISPQILKLTTEKERKKKKKSPEPFLTAGPLPADSGDVCGGQGMGENPELPAHAAITHTPVPR